MCPKFYENHSFVVQVIEDISLQCKSFYQIQLSVYFWLKTFLTGRAYIGEVQIQVWLKSIKKWVSYLDKQMNAQKECLKIKFRGSRKPTKRCAMKMKVEEEKKTTTAQKYFYWREGVYKAVSEDWPNRFRWTSGYWFSIQWRY